MSRQHRSFPEGAEIECRAGEGESPVLAGYAAVFDSWTVLHRSKFFEYREVVRPGAFRNALAERQDVRALFNHDANHVLARTKPGTLRLREDSKGLNMELDPPATQFGRDVVEMIRRGDVSQMSFAFVARSGGEKLTVRTEGDVEIYENEILDVDLYDVAPVTYPAYRDTEVAVRTAGVVRRHREERLKSLRRRIEEAVRRSRKA